MHLQWHPESAGTVSQHALGEQFPFVTPQQLGHPSNFYGYTQQPQGWPQTVQSSPHNAGQYLWQPYGQHPQGSFLPSYTHHLQQHVGHPSYEGYIPMSAPPMHNFYTPHTQQSLQGTNLQNMGVLKTVADQTEAEQMPFEVKQAPTETAHPRHKEQPAAQVCAVEEADKAQVSCILSGQQEQAEGQVIGSVPSEKIIPTAVRRRRGRGAKVLQQNKSRPSTRSQK
ncbi:hypothetical protein FKM82_011162 [Ascaphus truei]